MGLILDILCLLNSDRECEFKNYTSGLLNFHFAHHTSKLCEDYTDAITPVVFVQLEALSGAQCLTDLMQLKADKNCLLVLLSERADKDVSSELVKLIDMHVSCDTELSSLFRAIELITIHEAQNIDDETRKKLIRERFLSLKNLQLVFRTIAQTDKIADIIALGSPICDHLKIGLFELLVNAVEHGNLEIGYDKKSELLEKGTLIEEIQIRQNDEKYRDRTVRVDIKTVGEELKISIIDQGKGFNPEPFFDFKPEKLLLPHGRGILLARSSVFTGLEYSAKGNQVTVTLDIKDY